MGFIVRENILDKYYLEENVNHVMIPDGIKAIGRYAFCGKKELRSVVIPASVTRICDCAFMGCEKLEAVYFSEGLKSIGMLAFLGCEALEEIQFPDHSFKIGEAAFAETHWLAHQPKGLVIVGKGILYTQRNLTGAVTLPQDITSISQSAFHSSGITHIRIPDTITCIPNRAFMDCTALESVTFPDTLIRIEESAFAGCTALKESTFPDELEYLGGMSFQKCTNLTSVSIPPKITRIDHAVFNDCISLSSVTLPPTLVGIGYAAFCGCNAFSSIHIPAYVLKIDTIAFGRCMELTAFTVSEENPFYSVKNGILLSKDGTTLLCVPAAHPNPADIPDGVTCIGSMAYYFCQKLTRLEFSKSVRRIAEHDLNHAKNCPSSPFRSMWRILQRMHFRNAISC